MRLNLDHLDYPESYECFERSFLQGGFAAVAPTVEDEYLASLDVRLWFGKTLHVF